MKYGICKCGKWGEAPSEFDERLHFMKCICGELMYLNQNNPREAGYRMSALIAPSLTPIISRRA